MHSRPSLLARLCLASVLLTGAASGAYAAPTVVVIPVGGEPGLAPSAATAKGLVEALNKETADRARLGYPLPSRDLSPVDVRAAEDQLANARKAFKNLDFAAVEADARQALGVFKAQVKAGGSKEGYVATLHLLAAAALFDGNETAAFKAMNDAVLQSSTEPEKSQFNPTVQQFFRKVLDKPLAEHKGYLRIEAPPAALIWFDGELQGPATGLHTARAGLRLVQVYQPGHAIWLRWLRIKPNDTRDLAIKLVKGPGGIAPLARALLGALEAEAPTRAVKQARARFSCEEVVIVGPAPDCSASRCPLQLRWAASDSAWKRSKTALYLGDGARTASDLLTVTASVAPEVRTCSLDSQCGMNERCTDGRCRRPRGLLRKWWFWTAVGAVAVAATVAIVVPLSRPDAPVIEIR